jgi:hypothetical protein
MATRIDSLTGVPETTFIQLMNDFRDFNNANIVTAIRDDKGTFTVTSTVFDNASAGGSPSGTSVTLTGKMSFFGGPDDHGVGPNEGLSLFDTSDIAANPDLFLPAQPPGTTGLARRLNPDAGYLACRWDLSVTPKSFLRTAKVKVTNPKNGQSEMARPADTGPAVFTGRIADLSPGLTKRLGLDTDDACTVEIPTPAGTQPPPAGAGIAQGVNLASIDSTLFASDMTRKLVVMTSFDQAIYWIINLTDGTTGGQSLLKLVNGATKVLRSDTTVFPIQATADIPATVADELNQAAPPGLATPVGGGPSLQPGTDISAQVLAEAKAFLGQKTNIDPRTDNGNLACAWAVNKVVSIALGKPISSDGNLLGVSTAQMGDVLTAHHVRVNSAAEAPGGAIIIAPSVGHTHGHVGIVSDAPGTGNTRRVLSNSSGDATFEDKFTVASFTSHYAGMGLQVLFFTLNPNQF